VDGDYTAPPATELTPEQIGMGLLNAFQYNLAQMTLEGSMLSGYRALLNDVPLYETVSGLLTAGLRDFCSAPNGDLIAWFPDYFGHYKQAGKMVISPMEMNLMDGPPTIGWSDEGLKTHQFVSSASFGTAGDAGEVWRTAVTAGVASVEFPELMMALFNISRGEAETMREDFLMRYGARPDFQAMQNITGSRQEFFFACHLFMQNWAAQFQTTMNITFMPELFPGMLACFTAFGVQGYVTETTDYFDLSEDAGFTTSVTCAPWSTIGNNPDAPAALPKGAPL
jgi:hypothetical protein